MKGQSPLSVYAVAGQIGFAVATPLVVFIGGGSWLVDRFGWAEWVKIVFVLLGIAAMVGSVASYLRGLLRAYDDLREKEPPPSDKRDHDYYDDNYKK
jgi:hypothetical protein